MLKIDFEKYTFRNYSARNIDISHSKLNASQKVPLATFYNNSTLKLDFFVRGVKETFSILAEKPMFLQTLC